MDDHRPAHRDQIRDFLATRRAKLTPELVGLPTSGRRRVPGLRREEVAVLAGVSTEWYTRLEKGHIGGVSEDVLDAVAQALQLDQDERTYLFDLARALLAPVFDSSSTAQHGRANIARYVFLDPGSQQFFVDWDAATVVTAALLRAEAGREPHDRALRDLVGELSTLSIEFRSQWAVHDVRIRHNGSKRLRHPQAGDLELTYQSLDLPLSNRTVYDLTIYTAEPGSTSEERLKLLASLAATQPAHPTSRPR